MSQSSSPRTTDCGSGAGTTTGRTARPWSSAFTANAAEAVKHTTIPILLIHGEDDRFVPCDMGREIAAANPAMVELHTFPDAGHGLSFLIDRERYERVAHAFFARALHTADVPT